MDSLQLMTNAALAAAFVLCIAAWQIVQLRRKLEASQDYVRTLQSNLDRAELLLEASQRRMRQASNMLSELYSRMVVAKHNAIAKASRESGSAVIPGGLADGWLKKVAGAHVWSLIVTGELACLRPKQRRDIGITDVPRLSQFRDGIAWLARNLSQSDCHFTVDVRPGMAHDQCAASDFRELLEQIDDYRWSRKLRDRGQTQLAFWISGTGRNADVRQFLVDHMRGIRWLRDFAEANGPLSGLDWLENPVAKLNQLLLELSTPSPA